MTGTDLTREEAGYTVCLTLVPDLAAPVSGVIEIVTGKVILDVLEVTPTNAHDAFRHTTLYSDRLREFLAR